MSDPFVKLWWVLALRGLAGLTLVVLAVAWPLFTLEALLFGFGLYAVVDGAVALYAGLERRDHGYPFWPFAVEGALGMLFGGAIIAFPDVMAFALWYLVAGWALATGVFELVAAIRLRRVCEGEMLLATAGSPRPTSSRSFACAPAGTAALARFERSPGRRVAPLAFGIRFAIAPRHERPTYERQSRCKERNCGTSG